MGRRIVAGLRAFLAARDGAAMVEFAILLPLFVALFVGTMTYGDVARSRTQAVRAVASSVDMAAAGLEKDANTADILLVVDSVFRRGAGLTDTARYRIYLHRVVVTASGAVEVWSESAGGLAAPSSVSVSAGAIAGVDISSFHPGDMLLLGEVYAVPRIPFLDWAAEHGPFHRIVVRQTGFDPCLASPEVGAVCWDGGVFMGPFGGRELVMAPEDTSASIAYSPVTVDVPEAYDETDGLANTDELLAVSGGDYPAAFACRELGPSWFMPSLGELSALQLNKDLVPMEFVLASGDYWSSTMSGASSAWSVDMAGGTVSSARPKSQMLNLRCIRPLH